MSDSVTHNMSQGTDPVIQQQTGTDPVIQQTETEQDGSLSTGVSGKANFFSLWYVLYFSNILIVGMRFKPQLNLGHFHELSTQNLASFSNCWCYWSWLAMSHDLVVAECPLSTWCITIFRNIFWKVVMSKKHQVFVSNKSVALVGRKKFFFWDSVVCWFLFNKSN